MKRRHFMVTTNRLDDVPPPLINIGDTATIDLDDGSKIFTCTELEGCWDDGVPWSEAAAAEAIRAADEVVKVG